MIKKIILCIFLFLTFTINVKAETIYQEKYIKQNTLFQSMDYKVKKYLSCGEKVYVKNCNEDYCYIDIKYYSYKYNLNGFVSNTTLTDEVPNCSSNENSSGNVGNSDSSGLGSNSTPGNNGNSSSSGSSSSDTENSGTSEEQKKILDIISITNSLDGATNIGVCYDKAVSSDYCYYSSGISFSSAGKLYPITNNYDIGYFIGKGFIASIQGNNNMAFCLDPALPVPTMSLNKVRELNLSNAYDKQLYRLYQEFVLNSRTSGNFDNNRAYFEYALRLLTIKFGYHYISSNSNYKNDGSVFMGCAKKIDNNIITNQNLSSLGLNTSLMNNYSTDKICFGYNEHKVNISNLYFKSTDNLIWENPLASSDFITVEKSFPNDGNPNYIFKFKVDFSNFWENDNSVEQLGLSEAQFSAYISVNGTACKNTGDCDAVEYTGQSYFGHSYQGDTISQNAEFIISFTPEQYKNYFGGGSGTISLNYQYNHPLDSSNVFIVRENATQQTYQRMVVVKNYQYSNFHTINVGEVNKDICKHSLEGYTDKNGNNVNTLAEFLNTCQCSQVNTSLLTSSELTYFNKPEVCGESTPILEIEKIYAGGINDCNGINDENVKYKSTLSDNYEDYTLKYTKIEDINKYCTETCVETININNLKGKYTTKAGLYFEFNEYPNLVANKSCNVNIDYNKWLSDYEKNLQELVEAYDAWKGAELAESSYKVSTQNDCNPIQVPCGETMCTVYQSKNYYHSAYYSLHKASGVKVVNAGSSKTYSSTCCGEPCNFASSSYEATFQRLSTKRDAINNLQDDLNACNNRLFTFDNETAKGFYKFDQDLKYYYEQTYSKDGSIVRNDNRSSFGGLDDSEFKMNSGWKNPVSDNNNKNDSIYVDYYSFNERGVVYNSIKTYYSNPRRTVEYKVNYYGTSVKKGIKNYTAEVEDISGKNSEIIKKNYIDLGYKYDTDVSAVAKNNNKNYYSFSALGDDNGTGALFNYFKNTDGNNSDNFITRECVYEITNELIDTSIIDDSKLNISYRMVDAANIDPNNRLISGEGFKNWLTDEAKAVKNKIEADAIGNNTYNPDNLEYSFELDSTTLQKIREMNKERDNYSDFIDYECDNGNKCKSKFVSKYAIKDNNKLKGIGRDSWKKYSKNSSNGKCYIDNEEVKCS